MNRKELKQRIDYYNSNPLHQQDVGQWLELYRLGMEAYTEALNVGDMEEAERIDRMLIPFFDGTYKEYYDNDEPNSD